MVKRRPQQSRYAIRKVPARERFARGFASGMSIGFTPLQSFRRLLASKKSPVEFLAFLERNPHLLPARQNRTGWGKIYHARVLLLLDRKAKPAQQLMAMHGEIREAAEKSLIKGNMDAFNRWKKESIQEIKSLRASLS